MHNRRNLNALVCLLVLLVAAAAWAGWTRVAGQTTWTAQPTSASFWRRDANSDLVPAQDVLLYDTTPKVLYQTNVTTYATGVWQLDSDRNYEPRNIDASEYALRNSPGDCADVEWDIDSNNDIMPKD